MCLLPKRLGLLLAALLLTCGPGLAASQPNILFLLSDDHSYPYLSCYGSPDVRTPTLDRLAAEGLRADRMFVSCPQCVPSRAALMTGRSPIAIRMGRFSTPLPADVAALPDLLRQKAGYFTGVAGRSYHLDGPSSSRRGADSTMARVMDERGLRTFAQRPDYVEQSAGIENAANKFDDFLAKAPKGKPWFLWLGFSDPHHVWTTKGTRGVPDPAKITVPPYLPDLPGVREDLARYLAEIEHLDGEVAEVLALLKKRGLAENTVIVFMGDNGMAFPHGKGALHDPGIAVPLIVRWPGVVRPGRVTSTLISGEDFAPTVMEIAGAKPPGEMSGVSFLKLLREEPFKPREYIFAERGPHGGDGGMTPDISAAMFDLSRCVRSDRYKLIYNCTPHQPVGPIDSKNGPGWQQMVAANAAGKLAPQFVRAYFTTPRPTFELYDLEKDPGEMNNLAGNPTFKAVEMELKRALTEKMVLDWDFLPAPLR